MTFTFEILTEIAVGGAFLYVTSFNAVEAAGGFQHLPRIEITKIDFIDTVMSNILREIDHRNRLVTSMLAF